MSALVHGSRIVPMLSGTHAVAEHQSQSQSLSRRAFLRGRFSAPPVETRPPWAIAAPAFEQACTRCDACIAVCPSRIMVRGAAGFPTIDFRLGTGECTFCGECATACQPVALRVAADAPPWRLKAVIGAACLAFKDVVCRSCGDSCSAAAIRFRPRLGGAALPELDTTGCTGCGACIGVCPSAAIVVSPS